MKSILRASTPGGSSTRSACPERRWRAALGLVLALVALPSPAAERLQDLAVQRDGRVELQWSPVDRARRGGTDASFHVMSADIPRVEYRLNVGAWVGRSARVVLVVPQPPGLLSAQAMQLRWRSQGGLRSGQGIAGERVVVFEGRVAAPVLQDLLDLNILIDSRQFTGRLQMIPHFEIEPI